MTWSNDLSIPMVETLLIMIMLNILPKNSVSDQLQYCYYILASHLDCRFADVSNVVC
jgi:hypothetical protein